MTSIRLDGEQCEINKNRLYIQNNNTKPYFSPLMIEWKKLNNGISCE